jgi:outer membrane protein TolC
MLKQRREAVQRVADDFRKLEAAADQAAFLGAECLRTMIDVRAAANLPINTGLAEIQMVMDATADLVRVRQKLIEAHACLAQIPDSIGIRGFGDTSECPPKAEAAPAHLRVVA